MEGVKFQSISIERGGYRQTISRNKQGDLYFTGFSTRPGSSCMEYRGITKEEAKAKLFEMIMESTRDASVNIDYKV